MHEHDNTTRSAVAGKQTEVAVLAGGCFWGVEHILRDVPGVIDTDVGYTGGWLENPTYDDTHDSKSGHAEAIRVTFDPSVLSYEDLLEQWFFKLHDPTTLNRQGNDVGTQYRSAIFPQTAEQRVTAARVKAHVGASGKWKRPVTTSIEPASTWYSAEAYHQERRSLTCDAAHCFSRRPRGLCLPSQRSSAASAIIATAAQSKAAEDHGHELHIEAWCGDCRNARPRLWAYGERAGS
jgi:methionine-S-sulfoxide reductase